MAMYSSTSRLALMATWRQKVLVHVHRSITQTGNMCPTSRSSRRRGGVVAWLERRGGAAEREG